MTAADKIAEARALIDPLTGYTPGEWRVVIDDDGNPLSGRPSVSAPEELDCSIVHWDGFVQEHWRSARGDKEIHSNARLIATAPALRDTVADLADLADAQAQENARLRAGPYVKPLEWRDLTYGMRPHWTANHPFGSIDIRQEDEDLEWRWVVRPFIGGRSNWPTLEEAKADAEADYRSRVRAALGETP